MSKIIFARTRYEYAPYVDYWRLVELSGFPFVYIDEIDFDDRDALYILSPVNGEMRGHFDNHLHHKKCRIAHWLLERPGEGGTLYQYREANRMLVSGGYFDFVIVSDIQLARDTGFHYVPMGTHADLGQPGTTKDIDFIGLMAYSGRRAFLFEKPDEVRTHHHGLTYAPNAWGDERHDPLQRSRFGLNIHQDPFMYCEPLRFALFAAYGLPILTETVSEENIYTDAMIQMGLANCISTCQRVVRDYHRWQEKGLALRAKMTEEMSFRACLENYL